MIKKWKPKRVRDDIIPNLPLRAQKYLAEKNNVSKSYISNVLYGRKQNEKIIQQAEIMAAIYIWQNRYVKYKSEIDIFNLMDNINITQCSQPKKLEKL